MTITWVNNVANPAGQTGDDYKVLEITGADGTSSVQIQAQPYPSEGAMVFSVWWKAASATTATVNVFGTTDTGDIGTTWSRFYVATPTQPSGQYIYITPAAGNDPIYLAMAQLEMGETPSDWRESQEDYTTKAEFNVTKNSVETLVTTVDSVVRETATPGVYEVFVSGGNSFVAEDNGTTVMRITKDGFTVNNNNTVVMQITPDAFTVANGSDTTMEITPNAFKVNTGVVEFNAPDQSLRMDGDGASMDNLTVNNQLNAPNIGQNYTGATFITVAPGYTTASLQAVFDAINNKNITTDITINIVDDIYEYVELSGITGAGSITIIGRDGTLPSNDLYGGVVLRNIAVPIYISYWNIYGGENASCVRITGCSYVSCDHLLISNMNGTRPLVDMRDGSKIYLKSTELHSNTVLLYANETVDLACSNLKGGTTDDFLDASGARITWSGTRPDGTFWEITPCLIAASASTLSG